MSMMHYYNEAEMDWPLASVSESPLSARPCMDSNTRAEDVKLSRRRESIYRCFFEILSL